MLGASYQWIFSLIDKTESMKWILNIMIDWLEGGKRWANYDLFIWAPVTSSPPSTTYWNYCYAVAWHVRFFFSSETGWTKPVLLLKYIEEINLNKWHLTTSFRLLFKSQCLFLHSVSHPYHIIATSINRYSYN